MTPLIVAGCPRGGTSLFAKLLVAAGLTTVKDIRSSSKYPSGYFEHVPLLMFHKAMERYPRAHTHHRADFASTTEPFLTADQLADPFVSQMAETAFEPLRSNRADFLKYPQLALSPDFLFDTIPDLRLALVWRDPVASVTSLARKEFGRDVFPFRGLRSVLLWNTYAYHVCRAKQHYGDRVAVVHIDRIVDGTCTVDQVLAPLGYSLPPTPASRVVDPGVWTHRASSAERARVRALDALASAAARRLGADPALTDIDAWAQRLEAVTTRCAAE